MGVLKRGLKVLGIILLFVLVLFLIVPLVIPFPAFPGEIGLDGLKEPDSLA